MTTPFLVLCASMQVAKMGEGGYTMRSPLTRCPYSMNSIVSACLLNLPFLSCVVYPRRGSFLRQAIHRSSCPSVFYAYHSLTAVVLE